MQALTKAQPSPYLLTDQPMPLACGQPGQNATQRQSGYSWPLRERVALASRTPTTPEVLRVVFRSLRAMRSGNCGSVASTQALAAAVALRHEPYWRSVKLAW